MKTRLAALLSTLGHPLLTVPFFVVAMLFGYEDFAKAVRISALMLGVFFLPVAIKMYWGTRKGTYTNFDISEKSQRQSWYVFALSLLFILTVIVFLTDQSPLLKWNVLLAFLLLAVAKISNFYLKSSLHVALNVFLACLLLPWNAPFGWVFLGFTGLVAWSRTVLNRHTGRELLAGALIGAGIGGLSLAMTMGGWQNRWRNTHYTYVVPPQRNDGIPIGQPAELDTARMVALTTRVLKNEFPNIHSILIARNNRLLYENYFAGTDEISGKRRGYVEHSIDDLHDCRSISKSVTSACIGLAIRQGLIKSVEEPIAQYFPEYAADFDTMKRKITIRHLLTMTAGFAWKEDISYRDPENSELQMDRSADPIGYVLSRPMAAAPGAVWNYNGGESQLLAQIIQKVSGEAVDQFAEKRLFQPLGIGRYEWLPLKKDMPAAASGLRLRSRDLLKIGLLYFNDGRWGEDQILEQEWVEQSLSPVVTRGENKGYGFQFWTYVDSVGGRPYPIAEAKGNGGQRLFFCKPLKAVVVITAGNYNQWDLLNDSHRAYKDYILPALVGSGQ